MTQEDFTPMAENEEDGMLAETPVEGESTVELKTNEEGKKYETEENGVFYGGDYLPKPSEEINTDMDAEKGE